MPAAAPAAAGGSEVACLHAGLEPLCCSACHLNIVTGVYLHVQLAACKCCRHGRTGEPRSGVSHARTHQKWGHTVASLHPPSLRTDRCAARQGCEASLRTDSDHTHLWGEASTLQRPNLRRDVWRAGGRRVKDWQTVCLVHGARQLFWPGTSLISIGSNIVHLMHTHVALRYVHVAAAGATRPRCALCCALPLLAAGGTFCLQQILACGTTQRPGAGAGRSLGLSGAPPRKAGFRGSRRSLGSAGSQQGQASGAASPHGSCSPSGRRPQLACNSAGPAPLIPGSGRGGKGGGAGLQASRPWRVGQAEGGGHQRWHPSSTRHTVAAATSERPATLPTVCRWSPLRREREIPTPSSVRCAEAATSAGQCAMPHRLPPDSHEPLLQPLARAHDTGPPGTGPPGQQAREEITPSEPAAAAPRASPAASGGRAAAQQLRPQHPQPAGGQHGLLTVAEATTQAANQQQRHRTNTVRQYLCCVLPRCLGALAPPLSRSSCWPRCLPANACACPCCPAARAVQAREQIARQVRVVQWLAATDGDSSGGGAAVAPAAAAAGAAEQGGMLALLAHRLTPTQAAAPAGEADTQALDKAARRRYKAERGQRQQQQQQQQEQPSQAQQLERRRQAAARHRDGVAAPPPSPAVTLLQSGSGASVTQHGDGLISDASHHSCLCLLDSGG